ncbi:MAG: nuclear transport factor 2 family protein [Rhodospirillales bacterium]|nr:nuclear transport factor 2 family protein [Rhodospirillales bacterium]MCB9980721.1 nuclear transport factor 2 family protein [Rhodospirillales bacterium]
MTNILETWLLAYKDAWETQNPDKIVQIFTEDAVYWETPFLKHEGRDAIYQYWKDVPGAQKDISFRYKILNADEGLSHWSATFFAGGRSHELDGIFMLTFDAQGRCQVLREWWHSKENSCS